MKWSSELVIEVPLPFLTVTSTVATVPGGDTAVIWVADVWVKLAVAVDPNVTAAAAVSCNPVITTVVPPDGGPELGVTFVTIGALV